MNELLKRVSFEMKRYQIESMIDGTFIIQDGYTEQIIRDGLTAADEPLDICDEMNARAAIAAMREPTKEMLYHGKHADVAAGWFGGRHYASEPTLVWQAMIDAALND